MLPPPAIITLCTGLSMRRSSCITLRMFCVAARQNTSSPASITVAPSGTIGRSPRKIAATRASTVGMCFLRSCNWWPTSGPPSKARTATRLTLPWANSSTCRASGNCTSLTRYSVINCSGQMVWSTAKQSGANNCSLARYCVARMRAMRVGTLNWCAAILHATRLISSLCVTAINRSASSMPARFRTAGCDALPQMVRKSSRSCKAFSRAPSMSTTVMSLASDTRLSATVEPTWPAPRMMVFTYESRREDAAFYSF